MEWNTDFSAVPIGELVLVRLSEPINLGSYGPDDAMVILAEFYPDKRFTYCGSPAVSWVKDYPLEKWARIPD